MEEARSIEVSAPDTEAAIRQGLAQLGVERDQAEITIISEGSRGLLGIGARPAVVRISLKPAPPTAAPVRRPEAVPPSPLARPSPPSPAPTVGEAKEEATRPVDTALLSPVTMEEEEEAEVAVMAEPVEPAVAERVARETLTELLAQMKVPGRIEARWVEPTEPEGVRTLVLDVFGEDLGVLIGRRGETLDALQFITRLIVSRELQRRVNLVVDVANYRVRREQALRQLAQRLALQAVQRRRIVSLEPMPAHERRIVHMALRNHPQVITESVGEGDERRVTIIPRELRRGRKSSTG